MNIANIQKLHYCKKKKGSLSVCSNIATHQVKLKSKRDTSEIPLRYELSYRCDEHFQTGTVSRKVYETKPFDQSYALQKINNFLKTLIGKDIVSSVHTAPILEVKYLGKNGAVMCYQNHSKKWKYVYYEQIIKIL